MMRDMNFTKEEQAKILEKVASCGSLWHAYTHKEIKVAPQTVRLFASNNEKFKELLEKAEIAGCEALLDEAFAAAYDNKDDVSGTNKAGKVIYNHEAIGRSKLVVDTLYRRAAKIHPDKYAENYYKPTSKKIKSKFTTGKTALEQINILQQEIADGKMPPETGGLLINSCQSKFTIEEFEPLKRKVADMELNDNV
jgi:hypothetical protein